jgi:hypothetical protein
LNELDIEFKKTLSATNPLSPAVFNLPIDAYERGCVREGKVTAVNYTENTISVLIDGITYPDVPFLYHTDADYGSYAKAKRELPTEDWPVFPTDASELFANSTRCFVIPEDGSYYINTGSGFVFTEISEPTMVLVFSYPEIPFDPDNPTAEVVLNKHIAFNIISDFDTSKSNAINRPTYWPLLYITRVVNSVAKLFVYDFNTCGVKRILNEAGDAWVDISGVDAASVSYWYNTCVILASTDALTESDVANHRAIGSLYGAVINGNKVGDTCVDGVTLAWEHDTTNDNGWPLTAHTVCVDCGTGHYVVNPLDETVWDCYSASGETYGLVTNVVGRNVLSIINDPAVQISKKIHGHTYKDIDLNLFIEVTFEDDIQTYSFTASQGRTDWADFMTYWTTAYTITGSVLMELDTEDSAFEVFRVCAIGTAFTEHYTTAYIETYTNHANCNCFVDRPTTQSYANTFTPDADLTDFINNVVLADEALVDNALTSLTTSLIYAPYDIRERTVI